MADIILLLSILSTVSFKGTSSSFTTDISEESYWSSSEDKCVPATPKVDVASIYPPIVYNVNNPSKLFPDNEEVWVGYYQVERAFEYIGCAQHRQLFDTDPKFVSIKGDPGHCFPGCGESTIIGVTKTRCYCLGDVYNNVTSYTESGCKEMCTHPLVACGQDIVPVEDSYLSVYKINPKVDVSSISLTETTQLPHEKKCLLISPKIPKRFYWEECLLEKSVMCFYDGRVEKVDCKNVSEYCSWINAANTCFQIGRFPTLYSNSKDVNRSDFLPLWTGLFKTNVVYKYNAYIPVERRHDEKKFGYLTKESKTNLKLKFAEDDSMKRVLCAEDLISKGGKLVIVFFSVLGAFGVAISPMIAVALYQRRNQTNADNSRNSFQVTCETEFIHEPKQTNDKTPISDEAGDGPSKIIQDDGTEGASEEIGIQNPKSSDGHLPTSH